MACWFSLSWLARMRNPALPEARNRLNANTLQVLPWIAPNGLSLFKLSADMTRAKIVV